jgi:hypothetical protein
MFVYCRCKFITVGRNPLMQSESTPQISLPQTLITGHSLFKPALYGCETSSLISKEDQRLRVFENRVLRRIYGFKREEVTGEWIKLHNDEVCVKCINILVRKRGGCRTHGRPRH